MLELHGLRKQLVRAPKPALEGLGFRGFGQLVLAPKPALAGPGDYAHDIRALVHRIGFGGVSHTSTTIRTSSESLHYVAVGVMGTIRITTLLMVPLRTSP